jgi:hypothetical protein
MIKIYDASDKIFTDLKWWVDLVELVSIEELTNSPHIFRIYKWKNPSTTRPALTLIVRDKHLAQQDFNSLDTARDLLSKFTLKGK